MSDPSRPTRESSIGKITNGSKRAIFVYDVFLLGPAFKVDRTSRGTVFNATPTDALASCPPNRTIPPLLIVMWPGRRIEGDFVDPEIRRVAPGEKVSLRIAVGPEPDSVVAEWNRFMNGDCIHSPYDAIVNWATFIESNPVRIP